MAQDIPLWKPDQNRVRDTLLWQFMTFVSAQTGENISSYDTLYRWSVTEKESFWSAVWDFTGVVGKKGDHILANGNDIEKACWFPEARLNFAENLLRDTSDRTAINFRAEDKVHASMSYRQLYEQVSAVAAWLRSVGLQPGDRVAGYLPNMPEAVVAMLATASLGGIWTSTSPDFGEESVIDRFGQTAPIILFTVNGYYYNGKTLDLRRKIQAVQQQLDSLEHTVVIPFTNLASDLPGTPWSKILALPHAPTLEFVPRSFNDPLYILYSSGTTGKPKCITHKVGGVLLQHLKEHQLHCDIRPGDRVFYFTTCGWMMWNWLVSGLASRASLVLYDGSPFYPESDILWRYAEETAMTLFGTSAKYIDTLKKNGQAPGRHCDLSALRTICSTGSVLAPESFDYVYEAIKQDVCLASISGGTDIVSCFVLGCPILPVYRGESQCRGLGMAVEVYDPAGRSMLDKKGELVCTATFPSQPLCFWGDEDRTKYHKAYFSVYENVWHHGDFVELTSHGGIVIYGRSDATLNPGGVRIGTAEIYRHVEQLDEVVESIAIGQEWEGDERVVLFVVLQPELSLNDELIARIKRTVRNNCSPRHIPAKVVQVTAIPRTKSGKIVELAVRETVHHRRVVNIHSLANPEALELYRNLPELQ